MPLNTPAKRRSALGVWQPWVPALPSPTDTPGLLDQADQQHAAWTYSGILAAPPSGPVAPPSELIRVEYPTRIVWYNARGQVVKTVAKVPVPRPVVYAHTAGHASRRVLVPHAIPYARFIPRPFPGL